MIEEWETVVDADRLAMTRTKRARSHASPRGRIRKAELPHTMPEELLRGCIEKPSVKDDPAGSHCKDRKNK